MKVIVKEDNHIHEEHIKNSLIKIKIQLDIQFDIITSNNIKEILNYNNNSNDVINIIDIIDEDQNYTGVDIAQMIRNINPVSPIIFLTAYDQFIKEVVNHNIQPLAYINKSDPNIDNLLLNTFRKILYTKSHFDSDKKLSFHDENGDRIFIGINDIYFIQTHPTKQKYTVIYTHDFTYTVKGKVSDFEASHNNLVKCSKSTLINKTKINRITKGTNPKNKTIIFDNTNIPHCILSLKYKQNLY